MGANLLKRELNAIYSSISERDRKGEKVAKLRKVDHSKVHSLTLPVKELINPITSSVTTIKYGQKNYNLICIKPKLNLSRDLRLATQKNTVPLMTSRILLSATHSPRRWPDCIIDLILRLS